jgi:hypothetical protein
LQLAFPFVAFAAIATWCWWFCLVPRVIMLWSAIVSPLELGKITLFSSRAVGARCCSSLQPQFEFVCTMVGPPPALMWWSARVSRLSQDVLMQKSFETIKALLAEDAFLKHPDHNKPFHNCCDPSDVQLGAVIMQDNAQVTCCSCKLDSVRKNHAGGEQELLFVVETLKVKHNLVFLNQKRASPKT